MNCAEAKKALEQSHDGELDMERSRTLREHLVECSDCATLAERLVRLRSAVRDGATYFTAPNELRRLVAERAMTSPLASLKRRIQLPRWGFAGSLAAAAALSVALTVAMILPQSTEAVAREVMANHVRSLMVDHLADVATSDQHTVKPWFAGKLDFSPDVRDFAGDGYTLLGGRLEYLNHRNVAALVYQHAKHFINAYTWPNDGPAEDGKVNPPTSEARQGFHVVQWSDGKMTWCLVSDASEATLMGLQKVIERKEEPRRREDAKTDAK